MNSKELLSCIYESREGSQTSRERLLSHYRPYIINTVGHICKRYINWSDEEASIGLLAFNKAIDTFDEESGRTFLNYGFLLIKRDLIDYFRKEKKHQSRSFSYTDQEEESQYIENERSIETYHSSVKATELLDEILEYDQMLSQYKVSCEELEMNAPKHHDTRSNLDHLSNRLLEDIECKQEFLIKKRLPVSLLSKKTGVSKKTIEKHRKYLIAIILLKINTQWVHLSEYIKN
jgi:RNA polymerase sigma factor